MADLILESPPGTVGVVLMQAFVNPERGVGTAMNTGGQLTAQDIVIGLAAIGESAERAARAIIEQTGQADGPDAAARLSAAFLDAREKCRRAADASRSMVQRMDPRREPPTGGRLSLPPWD